MKIVWNQVNDADCLNLAPGSDMPMQQHPHYAAATALMGGRSRRAVIERGGTVIGLAQVMSRAIGPLRLSLLSRGPVWLAPQENRLQVHALRQLARGAGVFLATTEEPVRSRSLLTVAVPRQQAVMDLRPATDELRAGMGGKWRNRLVRAETSGLSASGGVPSLADLEALLRVESDMRRARRYLALPPDFTRAWHHAQPDAMRFYEARLGGRRVAMMLMLLHPPWASYHIGWTGAEGRLLNAHNALMWVAMQDLKSRGYSALDLGLVDRRANPGLARFKAETGARVAPLGATQLVLPTFTRRRW